MHGETHQNEQGLIFVSWKELLKRYDELKGLSDEELDSLLGKEWAYIFKGIRDMKEGFRNEEKTGGNETDGKGCGDDYCEF